jgi:hypothetical protein
MATYRAYIVGPDGRFTAARVLPECNTDEEALQAARQYVNGCDVQVWNLDRVVATISSENGDLVYRFGS